MGHEGRLIGVWQAWKDVEDGITTVRCQLGSVTRAPILISERRKSAPPGSVR